MCIIKSKTTIKFDKRVRKQALRRIILIKICCCQAEWKEIFRQDKLCSKMREKHSGKSSPGAHSWQKKLPSFRINSVNPSKDIARRADWQGNSTLALAQWITHTWEFTTSTLSLRVLLNLELLMRTRNEISTGSLLRNISALDIRLSIYRIKIKFSRLTGWYIIELHRSCPTTLFFAYFSLCILPVNIISIGSELQILSLPLSHCPRADTECYQGFSPGRGKEQCPKRGAV